MLLLVSELVWDNINKLVIDGVNELKPFIKSSILLREYCGIITVKIASPKAQRLQYQAILRNRNLSSVLILWSLQYHIPLARILNIQSSILFISLLFNSTV